MASGAKPQDSFTALEASVQRLYQAVQGLSLALLGDTLVPHPQQEGSVADFNCAFDSFVEEEDIPEEFLVKVYLSSLKEEIANPVRLFCPKTLHDTKILARMQEITDQM